MAPRSSWSDDLMLAGATALATLAIYRHVCRSEPSVEREQGAAPALAETQDRGRLAETPLQIPAAGWKDVLLRTYQQIDEDRLLATAAGVVFYGLLAIFPAITALVSSYGLFADPSTISSNLQSLALMLPEGSFAVVQDQVARVLAKGSSTLGLTFGIGLLIAIWSANAGMKAVFDALNVVYEEEKRGFIKLNLMSLSFTIAALISIMLMVGAVVLVPLLLQQLGLGIGAELIVRFGRWPILLLLLLVALAVLYRYGPSRTEPRWQWLSVGAVAAAVLWLIGSSLLSWYLANFGNYSATYGSLGAAIGLMTWMWMSAIIVLCGAELNSEIEHQTAIDSTAGRRKPLGARGARMADTVGRAS
ncbi:YihY/virulence factor BrkB family protein [Bradyrhizobium viridifuturi]|uniref:YihY/virulence factor BrkB family protein n=1 Tax=Bradyrhizobium viridifuturi TaxID=1654716 RepID=UPI00067F6331|nr:YihY/virulence factor BrkB family protein [Bradyrhizobium viridifuturi]